MRCKIKTLYFYISNESNISDESSAILSQLTDASLRFSPAVLVNYAVQNFLRWFKSCEPNLWHFWLSYPAETWFFGLVVAMIKKNIYIHAYTHTTT